MAYSRNMRSAALRHYRDAEMLFQNKRFDTAGYHYGISAECALKSAMERVGLIPDDVEVDGRSAYYVHFPELKRVPARHAGRLSQKIATMLARANFLQEWQVRMRYSADNSVPQPRCERWRTEVFEFNNSCMGL